MNKADVLALIRMALAEDLGSGDVTTDALVSKDRQAKASFETRESGTLAGMILVPWIFEEIGPGVTLRDAKSDGAKFSRGDCLGVLEGPAHLILKGERTALNFVQRLSGIASFTAKCCAEVQGYPAKILDTRKTIPGFRALDKYAVRMGGGHNHRIGLYDQFLIKDNHLSALGGNIAEAVSRARRHANLPVELEVTNLQQLREALAAGVDIVLLDNMSLEEMKQSVALVKEWRGAKTPETEASGGISFDRLKLVAQTGVDRISIGALTHSVKAVDIALEMA